MVAEVHNAQCGIVGQPAVDIETEHDDRGILIATCQLIEFTSEPFLDLIVEGISPAGTFEPVGTGDPDPRLLFIHT